MPTPLIDRVGRALLLEPMTRDDIAMALHETPRDVARELLHLASSRMIATRQDTVAELAPIYFLTRAGMEWAQSGIESVK